MNERRITLLEVTIKSIAVHTVTYFFIGLLAFQILDYAKQFADPQVRIFMRQTSDPIVMMGPVLQPIRGFLFGIVFFLLREVFFKRRQGWLVMWLMLVIVGILSTFGAAPGSIEGMIYKPVKKSQPKDKFRNQLFYRIFFEKMISIKVFPNGVIHLTGTKPQKQITDG